MNVARRTRRWPEPAGDPARMVEALVDQIDDPASGLVTRDFLRAELAQVREEIARLRGELRSEIASVRAEIAGVRGEIWRVVLTVFGARVVLIGILVTILFQILR